MKALLVIRHCKSDWDLSGLSDHDRPLNPRGKKDAPRIAKRLLALNPKLDRIYHSTAKRASDTTMSIFSHMNSETPISSMQDLYTFSCDEVLAIVRDLPENESNVCIVAHNPALTEFIESYTTISLDNLPTGGFCLIHFDVNKWSEIEEGSGKVKYLEYPKMLK